MAPLLSLSLHKPISPLCALSSPTTPAPPTHLDLQQQFGRKGISFTDAGAVELAVRNGSSLRLRISDGVVTSYKPKVYWKDDAFEELLYTVQPDDAKGGVGLLLDDGNSASPSQWVVKDSDSDSIDAVQVELRSTNGDGSLDITYIVSLYEVSMATAVVVKNNGRKAVTFRSAMLSHLRFKSRKGSAIQGLIGCSYCSYRPPSPTFGILSPSDAIGSEGKNRDQNSWIVESDKYVVLKDNMSRIYAAPPQERLKRVYNTPPSKYETIDQGTGLGFRVIRMGYEDIFICSPGSLAEKYGKDYFICTGPASLLVPVTLNPGEEWRGAQVVEHDNL